MATDHGSPRTQNLPDLPWQTYSRTIAAALVMWALWCASLDFGRRPGGVRPSCICKKKWGINYPGVQQRALNCHITMRNHRFYWENCCKLLSIVIFHSYVKLAEGISRLSHYPVMFRDICKHMKHELVGWHGSWHIKTVFATPAYTCPLSLWGSFDQCSPEPPKPSNKSQL